MKYRVLIKVGYNNAYFDFDSMQSAGDFAVMALTHQVENEDTKKKMSIGIEVIDPSLKEVEDE